MDYRLLLFSWCLDGTYSALDSFSFPTRRSSDLDLAPHSDLIERRYPLLSVQEQGLCGGDLRGRGGTLHGPRRSRSEEHTSELQSRQYLVCRLLLEKKK